MVSEGSAERGHEPLPELFSATRWRELASALELTRRQIEVARLICRGLTNEQIARELGRSASIVRGHSDKLYQRLNVHSRVGVVVRVVLTDRQV